MITNVAENEGNASPHSNNLNSDNKVGNAERRANDSSDGESNNKRPKIEPEAAQPANNKPTTPFSGSRGPDASFPPTSTTDGVRLKSRELLMTAIKGDGSTGLIQSELSIWLFI